LLALTLLTRREVSYWRTTETLFTRAEAVTKDNVVAHNALGLEAMAKGDFASAAQHLGEALRLNPSGFETADNYGVALAEQERYDEAIALYKRALELNPRYPNAHNNWGNALLRQGQFDEAISHYTEALRLDPEYADALNSMGAALISQDKPGEAVAFLTKAVTFAPAEAQYRLNLAVALDLRGDAGDEADAIASAREALRLDPKFTKAVNFLKMVHAEP
jgi:Flp pilus assembly protein TadD